MQFKLLAVALAALFAGAAVATPAPAPAECPCKGRPACGCAIEAVIPSSAQELALSPSPFWDSWPGGEGATAPNGVFVLLKIDPIASVAALEDEETTRAAAALDSPEWVLGVIVSHRGGRFSSFLQKPLMSLQMELFGHGPPDDKAIASIPISPSPQLYDDRPPVKLSSPLPWPNVYCHTNCASSVIISRIHYGATKFEANLAQGQFEDLSRRAFSDRYNWHSLPPATTPDPPGEVIFVDPGQPEGPYDDNADDSSYGDQDSLYAQEMEEMGMKIARQRIYGEISLDPSMCPGGLGDPSQLEEPVARIRELWADWEERRTTEILARRPETTLWAQDVADACSDLLTEPENAEEFVRPPASFDDIAVFPEDAVGTSAEREPRGSNNRGAYTINATPGGPTALPEQSASTILSETPPVVSGNTNRTHKKRYFSMLQFPATTVSPSR
ncbi:hypothetical protein AURDEDRAFT_128520 [Auricularia subglabra TFB-10046 SS5]|uniref:Uncharacterized protein n=1 Tax=Auricularia subglabra (strain TFB-10046 / SS5) TaxID=717982 RepID=J0D170_AURST|nr:hypothetical protein AURDEDRAFT_128520 [Auricularia subglabra TFB-10046 SS5]